MNILSDSHVQFIHKHMAFDYKYVCEKNASASIYISYKIVVYQLYENRRAIMNYLDTGSLITDKIIVVS